MAVSADGSGAPQAVRRIVRDQRLMMRSDALIDSAIVFWRGTSGHAYVHTAYALFSCPPMPRASVLFVRRAANGERRALATICVEDASPTLNLARVRHLGARLRANEIHLHFSGASRSARSSAAADLGIRHCGSEPVGR